MEYVKILQDFKDQEFLPSLHLIVDFVCWQEQK